MLWLFIGLFMSIQIVGASWVDPDTPEYYRTTVPMYRADKREYELVSAQPP